jgi:hypothetical protein
MCKVIRELHTDTRSRAGKKRDGVAFALRLKLFESHSFPLVICTISLSAFDVSLQTLRIGYVRIMYEVLIYVK